MQSFSFVYVSIIHDSWDWNIVEHEIIYSGNAYPLNQYESKWIQICIEFALLLSRVSSCCLREHVFVCVSDAEAVDDYVDHRYEEDDDDDYIVQDVGSALARFLVNVHPSDHEEENANHELRLRSLQ